MNEARITVPALARRKARGEKLAMITAYDFAFARIFDAAGVDVLLVGDSLGNVVQGNETTLPVTLDEMVYHTGVEQAVASAVRLMKDGGAHAVKLEGGERVADRIEAIARMEIPVMGHVGLTPQSVHQFGGFRVQGRGDAGHDRVLRDARAVEAAGAFAVVLECVPKDLAREVTQALSIPTIGIGAGVGCDGQVLVMHDLLGLSETPPPRFVRQYVALGEIARRAVEMWAEDVRNQKFPGDAESY
jgi:3-methyl-2-oxobutanoate hydroxymethyltransferase